ncbi:MAG: SWIB/MDM2 domain-containing protein [Gammaproteobacteria bacterium]|nr:SWIB/MDM2 domain-containing protein [Gammaproteobacteria bacterium]
MPEKKTTNKSQGQNSAFMKPMNVSPALAAVVGSQAMPRTAVVAKIWEYIKKHNLQDAANKRNINADDKLLAIFGKKQVSMFELSKILSNHLS